MIKTVEATGKTIDDAIENAVALLGVDRYEVDVAIEILDRPKAGFLGIGGTPAKIRASYDDGVPEPKPVTVPKPVMENKPESVRPEQPARPERPERTERPERPERQERPERTERPETPAAQQLEHMTEKGMLIAEKAHGFLAGLLERMNTQAEIVSGELSDGTVEIRLEGENLGALIGRRGETLSAIQHITNFVVNKGNDDRTRITVDVEDYRRKREETLRKLALRTASKVVKMHRNITLEPMNAYERHVIHTALQDWRDVSTFSTGSEPRRAVVVSYTPGGGSPRPPRRDGERRDFHGDKRGGERRNRPPREQKPAEPRPESKPLEVKEFH